MLLNLDAENPPKEYIENYFDQVAKTIEDEGGNKRQVPPKIQDITDEQVGLYTLITISPEDFFDKEYLEAYQKDLKDLLLSGNGEKATKLMNSHNEKFNELVNQKLHTNEGDITNEGDNTVTVEEATNNPRGVEEDPTIQDASNNKSKEEAKSMFGVASEDYGASKAAQKVHGIKLSSSKANEV
jgi:hypothetical protein